MEKLKALWALFKKGEAVADPSKWKNRQISITMLAGLLVAAVQLAKAFNVEIPIDNDTATAIAGGIIASVNVVLTLCTSKHVGLPATQPSVPSVQPSLDVAAQKDVQHEPVSNMEHSGIDEDTRKRAEQFIKQQTSNGLASDA